MRLTTALLPGLLAVACAAPQALDRSAVPRRPAFALERDSFAFPNLVRAENPGRNDVFANYCIVMSRAATQFFRFARFAPELPRVPADDYARLTAEVLAIDAWEPPRPAPARVVIPGYRSLREFSQAHEAAVKATFGSNVLSMVHWRTWRVGFALSPEHQAGVATELEGEIDAGRPVPLMLTNFPDPDLLNHAVLVYDYRVGARTIEFLAYDPNDPDNPLGIHFDRETRGFWMGPLPYSPPGRIRAFRLYGSPLL